ncbi:MAG: hypothetical protein KJ077_10725 [Anaerolineae bacterium]|nr:hypothetical protein [Anaerolineae bacterium]
MEQEKPTLRKTAFWIDVFEHEVFSGYTFGDKWNGWACPIFELAEAQRLVRLLNRQHATSAGYWAAGDTFYVRWGNAESEEYQGGEYEFEGRSFKGYAIGAYSWCWEESPVDIALTPAVAAWLKLALRHDSSNGNNLGCPLAVWNDIRGRGWTSEKNGWIVLTDKGREKIAALLSEERTDPVMLAMLSEPGSGNLKFDPTAEPWREYLVTNESGEWVAMVRDRRMARLFAHSLDLARYLYSLYEHGDIPVNPACPENWLKLDEIMTQLLNLK